MNFRKFLRNIYEDANSDKPYFFFQIDPFLLSKLPGDCVGCGDSFISLIQSTSQKFELKSLNNQILNSFFIKLQFIFDKSKILIFHNNFVVFFKNLRIWNIRVRARQFDKSEKSHFFSQNRKIRLIDTERGGIFLDQKVFKIVQISSNKDV